MPHFFINSKSVVNDIITVQDLDTVRHLAGALRVRTGEIVKFIDENKMGYEAEVISLSKKEIALKILRREISKRELEFEIYVAGSVLKTEAQGLFISNAAQTGAKGLYPFVSDFSTVKGSVARLKVEKWQKISDEAFKQCERADIMKVFEIEDLKEIIKKFKKENIIIFAERNENRTLIEGIKDIDVREKILVVTGPEGGFSDKEFEYFTGEGFKLVTLGNLIYKAPNAVVAGVSNLIFALQNSGKI